MIASLGVRLGPAHRRAALLAYEYPMTQLAAEALNHHHTDDTDPHTALTMSPDLKSELCPIRS